MVNMREENGNILVHLALQRFPNKVNQQVYQRLQAEKFQQQQYRMHMISPAGQGFDYGQSRSESPTLQEGETDAQSKLSVENFKDNDKKLKKKKKRESEESKYD